MYVKVFQSILEGSLSTNRKLRHFFVDLLLLANPDGTVMRVRERIASAIGADIEEVDWGLAELGKADPLSNSPEHEGRRIIPLEGHPYGWKIVNFEMYRDLKNREQEEQMRRGRVGRCRERRRLEAAGQEIPPELMRQRSGRPRKQDGHSKPLLGEVAFCRMTVEQQAAEPGNQIAMPAVAAGVDDGPPGIN